MNRYSIRPDTTVRPRPPHSGHGAIPTTRRSGRRQVRPLRFGGELEQVLRALACGGCGLPPLSIVVLVFAACRDAWARRLAGRSDLVGFAKCLGLDATDIGRLEDGLTKISRFSPELRQPIEAKLHLLQFLFETGGAAAAASRPWWSVTDC